mmetsp:Transcript_33141/g.53741  ORF Transcript_33141/g.53741 Transcript_33141/m.53741 type:complete len:654 (+) Transcript_33141:80-2041(+)
MTTFINVNVVGFRTLPCGSIDALFRREEHRGHLSASGTNQGFPRSGADAVRSLQERRAFYGIPFRNFPIRYWSRTPTETCSSLLQITAPSTASLAFCTQDRRTAFGGYAHTEESRRKISVANKGRVPWNKGKHHSEETKKKIASSTRAAMLMPEIKQKLREHQLGRKHTPETRAKIKASLRSPDVQERLRVARERRYGSIERRRKRSQEERDISKEHISEQSGMQSAAFRQKEDHVENGRSEGSTTVCIGDDGVIVVMLEKISDGKQFSFQSDGTVKTESKPSRRSQPMSEETRAKLSVALKARWQDSEYRARHREGMVRSAQALAGRKLSEEHRERIRQTLLAKYAAGREARGEITPVSPTTAKRKRRRRNTVVGDGQQSYTQPRAKSKRPRGRPRLSGGQRRPSNSKFSSVSLTDLRLAARKKRLALEADPVISVSPPLAPSEDSAIELVLESYSPPDTLLQTPSPNLGRVPGSRLLSGSHRLRGALNGISSSAGDVEASDLHATDGSSANAITLITSVSTPRSPATYGVGLKPRTGTWMPSAPATEVDTWEVIDQSTTDSSSTRSRGRKGRSSTDEEQGRTRRKKKSSSDEGLLPEGTDNGYTIADMLAKKSFRRTLAMSDEFFDPWTDASTAALPSDHPSAERQLLLHS